MVDPNNLTTRDAGKQTASAPQFTLPPTHFLSLPPTHAVAPGTGDNTAFLHNTSDVTTSSAAAGHNLAVNTATTASADFDVDVRTGFMPPEPPVKRLPSQYDVWEQALWSARGEGRVGQSLRLGESQREKYIGSKEEAWRTGIQEMPILSITPLRDSVPKLRRAHVVLTFLMHFYVHSQPPSTDSSQNIPASIAAPLLQVCPLLGLPPILTYADTVLWNSHPANVSRPPSILQNDYVTSLETFTNTTDEAHFYLTSARCDLAGVEALSLMRASLDEAFMADNVALTRLTKYLHELAKQIDIISDIIMSVQKGCDPGVFYHIIRPWFKGGDANGPDSLGWIFAGVDDETAKRRPSLTGLEENVTSTAEHRSTSALASTSAASASSSSSGDTQPQNNHVGKGRKFSGPSAGQSSLIHAIDCFLTVDHAASTAAAAEDGKTASAEQTFMTRMLQYMPQPHRSFLHHLQQVPHPVRSLVLANKENRPALAAAYDEALTSLKRLRDRHMRIASMYIIQQARRPPTPELVAMGAPMPEGQEVEAEAANTSSRPHSVPLKHGALSDFFDEAQQQQGADEQVRGTGGTALIQFLKMCRDNTVKTMVGK